MRSTPTGGGLDVAEALLDGVALQPGPRVLELACGPGGLGLAAAERVGPEGKVVVSDVVTEMTAIAAARARERGLTNVTARGHRSRRDRRTRRFVRRRGLPRGADVRSQSCAGRARHWPDLAARRARRHRGAGDRGRANPWLQVVFDELGAQLGTTLPPPGVPGPFSLDDADTLAGLFTAAGLRAVTVTELPTGLRADVPRSTSGGAAPRRWPAR